MLDVGDHPALVPGRGASSAWNSHTSLVSGVFWCPGGLRCVAPTLASLLWLLVLLAAFVLAMERCCSQQAISRLFATLLFPISTSEGCKSATSVLAGRTSAYDESSKVGHDGAVKMGQPHLFAGTIWWGSFLWE